MAQESRETRQKKIIAEEIAEIDSFFTGEDLFLKVKSIDSSLGIATVYRFLKDLRKKGMIHSYTCQRKMIYSREKKSHCHFICERCKKVEHISIENLNFLHKHIKNEICHFQLDLYGICKACAGKK